MALYDVITIDRKTLVFGFGFEFGFLIVFVFVFVFFSKLKPWGGARPLLEAPLRLIGPFPKQPLCTHSNDRAYAHTPMIEERKLSLQ